MIEQINRIMTMEDNLNKSKAAIDKLSAALDEFESVCSDYCELENYYDSKKWLEDFAADEAGLIPQDIRRGVLSEDAVYDLITEYNEIMQRMREITAAEE